MQNGTAKMNDTRYNSLYNRKVDPMKGKQLDGETVKVIPTWKETAYKNGSKKV